MHPFHTFLGFSCTDNWESDWESSQSEWDQSIDGPAGAEDGSQVRNWWYICFKNSRAKICVLFCFSNRQTHVPERLFWACSSQHACLLLLRNVGFFFIPFVSGLFEVAIHPFLIRAAYTFVAVFLLNVEVGGGLIVKNLSWVLTQRLRVQFQVGVTQ